MDYVIKLTYACSHTNAIRDTQMHMYTHTTHTTHTPHIPHTHHTYHTHHTHHTCHTCHTYHTQHTHTYTHECMRTLTPHTIHTFHFYGLFVCRKYSFVESGLPLFSGGKKLGDCRRFFGGKNSFLGEWIKLGIRILGDFRRFSHINLSPSSLS